MAATPPSDPLLQDLLTVRDWLRYAASRFEMAGLVYGHGTGNAVDEAAFLILSALHLPIDDAGPWLDCRLTLGERGRICALIEERVTTRKPAPYLVHQAYIGGHKFYVDERVIIPRSFIGELLDRGQIVAFLPRGENVSGVLELCTGSGCLAILAALAFADSSVTAIDISHEALEVARRNVADYRLSERISLLHSDVFDAVPRQKFDLIIANPPYVTQRAVDAFPPEYRAEPELAHLGGADGLDIVHRILKGAGDYLSPAGALIVEIGQARDALEAARPDLPFLWIDTEASEGEVFVLTAAELAAAKAQGAKTRKPKSGTGLRKGAKA